MLKTELIKNQKVWDDFVTRQTNYTFFHSYAWGEFLEKKKEKIWRYGIYHSGGKNPDKLIGVALISKVPARRGTFLFCPHGPIFIDNKSEYWQFFLDFYKKLGKKENVAFVRISPVIEVIEVSQNIFSGSGFFNAPIHMSAESSWILDLKDKSEEQLLAEMRKTTRYEIRRALKNATDGEEKYQVVKTKNPEDLKVFLDLYHQTVDRTHFVPFSDRYLQDEFETMAKNNNVMLFLEKHGDRFVAALMVIFYGKGVFYHQGATKLADKETVSYLAQWEVIKEAKKRGCEFYNFWGIAPTDERSHPWYGLSLFKKGFGGKQVNFVHAQDYPIKWTRYIPTYIIEKVRKFRRGL